MFVETFLKKTKILIGHLKRVANWAKISHTIYVCKIVMLEEIEMPDFVKWIPKPFNMRPHILSSVTAEIYHMHNKTCNELNNRVPVLRPDQNHDIKRKIEEQLYNDPNLKLEQNPMVELVAWHEYSLQVNRVLGGMTHVDTYAETVNQYLAMYP